MATGPAAGVKVPDIAQLLGMHHRRMAHQQGTQACHGLGVALFQALTRPLANLANASVVFKQQAIAQCMPVVERAVGMQQADQAGYCLYLQGNRQLQEPFDKYLPPRLPRPT